MAVTGASHAIANDAGAATSTSNATDFGNSEISSGGITKTFTIANNGSVALSLSNPVITGSNLFTLVANPAASVAAGATTTFQVKFNPTVVGAKTALVSITNGDTATPYKFSLSGAGIVAPKIDVTGGNGNVDIAADGSNTPGAPTAPTLAAPTASPAAPPTPSPSKTPPPPPSPSPDRRASSSPATPPTSASSPNPPTPSSPPTHRTPTAPNPTSPPPSRTSPPPTPPTSPFMRKPPPTQR